MFQPHLDRGGRIGGRLIDAGHAPASTGREGRTNVRLTTSRATSETRVRHLEAKIIFPPRQRRDSVEYKP